MNSKIRKREKKKSFLITAGPTREKIDPVRFISNYSTGAFGYEIAKEAKRRGGRVTLISGPTSLKAPGGVKFIRIESAFDMRRAVKKEIKTCDCLIMAAAVSDWRVKSVSKRKIRRHSHRRMLKIVENPDILRGIGRNKRGVTLIGFALETEGLEKNAFKKLKEKNLDLIIANRLSPRSKIFGDNPIDVLVMDRFGNKTAFRHKSKTILAKIILDKILNFEI